MNLSIHRGLATVESIEDVRQILRFDPKATISYGYYHRRPIHARIDTYPAVRATVLHRIINEILQALQDAIFLGQNWRQIGGSVFFDLELSFLNRGAAKRDRAVNQLFHREQLRLVGSPILARGECQNLLHHAFEPPGLIADQGAVKLHLILIFDYADGQVISGGAYYREGRPELM